MPSARKNVKPEPRKKTASILRQLLAELDQDIHAKEGSTRRKVTKGQMLVRSLVSGALEGDQRMLANVLRLLEKLDFLPEEKPVAEERHAASDWETMFVFFGKYKTLIEQEIAQRKETNPSYWSFEWFHPTLETAPWYEDLYTKKPG